MTDTSMNAVYIMNRFVFDILKSNGAIEDRPAYGGRTPIIPSQQVPEFNQYNKPFLVYGFSESPSDIPSLRTGTVAYAVYDVDPRKIVHIINVLSEALRHWDESARELNAYKADKDSFRDIVFSSLYIGLVEGPSGSDQEGGRDSGVISIRYTYSPDYSIVMPTTMT